MLPIGCGKFIDNCCKHARNASPLFTYDSSKWSCLPVSNLRLSRNYQESDPLLFWIISLNWSTAMSLLLGTHPNASCEEPSRLRQQSQFKGVVSEIEKRRHPTDAPCYRIVCFVTAGVKASCAEKGTATLSDFDNRIKTVSFATQPLSPALQLI